MYNSDIENLINLALADGELTEKEKQILYKKAESAGIDLDEFELVLEAKLFERQKSKKESAAPKSDKLGDVKKCPGCGAISQSFATRCSDCGIEFRNIDASKNITKFFDKLDELESSRRDNLFDTNKQETTTSVGTLLKWWFFWWILIPLKIITYIVNKSKPAKWSVTDTRKEELIMNFPVPNSREEIVEFITLSVSKIQSISFFKRFDEEGKYLSKWNSIWKKKAEQVFNKAKLSMTDDRATIQALEQLLVDADVISKKK